MAMTIDAMASDNVKKLGIYIHIPFCRSKCMYCDFCSFPQIKKESIELYVNRLVADILSFELPRDVKYLPTDTVYFGGGTPSLLDIEHFEKILLAIKEKFQIANDAEITAECNPKTATREKLSAMRNLGINRLSIGVQSSSSEELKLVGRAHTYLDCRTAVLDARDAGFDNISLDIMYGLPSQTLESFKATLSDVIALSPNHISSYALKLEEGTPLYRLAHKYTFPDEDEVCDMYEQMCNTLSSSGYNRYEVSNFAREGYESRHNLKYWDYEDYIGFGVSAHSFVCGKRIENSRDFDFYINGGNIVKSCDLMDFDTQRNEYVMLSMRLSRGVDREKYENLFGSDFYSDFGARLEKYSPEFVTLDSYGCRFTEKGFFVSNYILSDVLEF